jgi:Type VI secretion system/phage-baseplate injector OB domain
MAGALLGRYRGTVLDNVDPAEWGRVLVAVPDVGADHQSWAMPSAAPNQQSLRRRLPAVGDTVFVEYEGGDVSYPVYDGGHPEPGQAADAGVAAGTAAPSTSGSPDGALLGRHRGVVLDTNDPERWGRIFVQVPVAGAAWAMPSEAPNQQGLERELPAIGDTVFVEYELGDATRPVYSGGRPVAGAVADGTAETAPGGGLTGGGGDQPGLFATYRALVLDNVDPTDLGRVSVRVPEVGVDGSWASPSESPEQEGLARELPNVGDTVFVEFEGGDVDRPLYEGGHVR